MKAKESVIRIKNFGLHHAIEDLPKSTLTVEAFNKAIELLRLEESGKLPILYIGDNIYFRVKGRNQFAEDVDFVQTQKISRIDIDQNGILYCTASVKFIESDINKTVFLTKEEAEDKLKETSE